jgi:predicted CoA-binding protein
VIWPEIDVPLLAREMLRADPARRSAMRHTGAVPQHHLVVPTLTKIARSTLYGSAALAVALGFLVWPAGARELGGAHAIFGWLTIVSLWTIAGISARQHVPRAAVWSAVGWGVLAAVAASAQYQLRAGSWITVLHVATGLGAVGFGQYLLLRMAHDVASDTGIALKDAAAEFLAKKRIAITGVSRKPVQHGSNIVYRRLRERGYQVFAINPHAQQVEGDRCYPDLKSIPGGVDAVVIATRPDRAMATMAECAELGIAHVWMHRAMGGGSVSEEAAAWGRARGMHVIAGGCPLMFDPTADTGHKIMRPLLTLTGKVPRRA